MRRLYAQKWTETVEDGHSKRVFSERIDPGMILHVHNCFAHAPEREVNDIMTLYLRNGGQDIVIRSRGGAAVKEGMSALNAFFLGEGDQIYAYFPDADNTDTIELHIIGDLFALDVWRQMRE